MTPLEIDLLLHYYCSPEPHERIDNELHLATVRDFVEKGLLIELPEPNQYGSKFKGNFEALDIYIKAICDVPLPEKRWVIPEKEEL